VRSRVLKIFFDHGEHIWRCGPPGQSAEDGDRFSSKIWNVVFHAETSNSLDGSMVPLKMQVDRHWHGAGTGSVRLLQGKHAITTPMFDAQPDQASAHGTRHRSGRAWTLSIHRVYCRPFCGATPLYLIADGVMPFERKGAAMVSYFARILAARDAPRRTQLARADPVNVPAGTRACTPDWGLPIRNLLRRAGPRDGNPCILENTLSPDH